MLGMKHTLNQTIHGTVSVHTTDRVAFNDCIQDRFRGKIQDSCWPRNYSKADIVPYWSLGSITWASITRELPPQSPQMQPSKLTVPTHSVNTKGLRIWTLWSELQVTRCHEKDLVGVDHCINMWKNSEVTQIILQLHQKFFLAVQPDMWVEKVVAGTEWVKMLFESLKMVIATFGTWMNLQRSEAIYTRSWHIQ